MQVNFYKKVVYYQKSDLEGSNLIKLLFLLTVLELCSLTGWNRRYLPRRVSLFKEFEHQENKIKRQKAYQ